MNARTLALAVCLALVPACASSEPTPPQPAPIEAPSPPLAPSGDPATRALLEAGTSCGRGSDGKLALKCPELVAIRDHAGQHQGDEEVGWACVGFLSDPDPKKRLLAAGCLDRLDARTSTRLLGSVLDAIETEQDPIIRGQIAWSSRSAEAATARLVDRVLAMEAHFAADPAGDETAASLLRTLFPQYLLASAPPPPPEAKVVALEAIGRDGSALQHAALNTVSLLDAPAVCDALLAAMEPGDQNWYKAADALADTRGCEGAVPQAVERVLGRIAAGQVEPDLLVRWDRVFDLGAPTRARFAKELKAARTTQPDWQHKRIDAAIQQLSGPRPS